MNSMKKIISCILSLVMLFAIVMSSVACADLGSAEATEHFSPGGSSSAVKPMSSTGGEEKSSFAMTEEEVDAARVAFQAEQIEALANTGVFDNEFVEALKKLYALYDEDLYLWLASLYDPEIGGFYYSLSARNTLGFLPDLESTAQALVLMDKSGLDGEYAYNDSTGEGLGECLPDFIKLALYNFAAEMRAEDGYFYHPQWGTNISTSRKGRDQGWGNRIMGAFASVAEASETVLTAQLGVSNELAASKVVPATLGGRSVSSAVVVSTEADYSYDPTPENNPAVSFSYATWDELKAYVDYWLFNVGDSYTMGNTINSNISAIQNNGLRDELVNYLIILYNEVYNNGFWETEISYNAINGVMKLCGIFGGNYEKFPNAYLTVSEILNILENEVTDGELNDEAKTATEAITFAYNQWDILYTVVKMMSSEERALVAQRLTDNSEALINGVYAKLALFKRDDGGFSYFQNRTSSTSQGASVAIPGTCESDVNSTSIAISTIRYVLRVYQLYCNYDFDIPLIYCNEDTEYFLSALEAQEQVEKIQAVELPETVTFEDEIAEPEYSQGVLLNPHSTVTTTLGQTTDENSDEKNDYFASSIVTDPKNDANKVLSVTVKSGAGSNSSTEFEIVNSGIDGETYVFETRMYVSNGSKTIAQIIFSNSNVSNDTSAKFNFNVSDTGLVLAEETYHKGDGAYNDSKFPVDSVDLGISTGSWFTLRIEITKNYDGGSLVNMLAAIKIKSDSDSDFETKDTFITGRYSGGEVKDYVINSVKIIHYRTYSSQVYYDDVYAAKIGCTDGNNDHKCDTCGSYLSECSDIDDHYCDICGAIASQCEDNNKDHLCDLCGNTTSTCLDGNSDHKCDVCGKTLSKCEDENSDHACDLCGNTISSLVDADNDLTCDICGEAVAVAYLQTTDCFFADGTVRVAAHVGEGLTVAPVYSGSVYTLDFWCVYSISGDTVTLVAVFEAGESYTISASGLYRITPVYLATTLAGVTDNTYSADTTTTDKTTSDSCLTSDWADVALSSKFNIYSSSSTAPLKTSNVTQLYVVADPTNAANTVLAWMSSGTSGTGYGNAVLTLNLDNTVQGNVYVIAFDYYVDYTYYSGASLYTAIGVTDSSAKAYELARLNHGGAAMANYSLNPDNVVTPGSATSYYSVSTRTSAAAASGKKAVYDTDTWYNVKLVIADNVVYTYMGLRGTDTYTLIDSQTFSGISSAGLSTFTLTADIYKNRSVIYYDNIGFYSTNTAPCVDGNGDCVCDICKTEAHSYTDVVTAPTCTERGYTTHTCDTCGNNVTDSLLPAKGHVYKDGVCDCGEIYAPAFDYIPTDTELEEGYLLAKDSEGNYTTVENTYFDYLGASIRYADADGNCESSTEVDIRFSYQLREGVTVKSWGWNYKLGNLDIATKDGKYITEDSITNLVLTNVVLCNLEKDMGVQFWFVVDIGGVEYTVYDTFRIRTANYVIDAYAAMTNETYSEAIEYAKKVQQEMLTYINTPTASIEEK